MCQGGTEVGGNTGPHFCAVQFSSEIMATAAPPSGPVKVPYLRVGGKWQGMEDPALCWIDLVAAYKKRDINRMREVQAAAKISKWTQELWQELIVEAQASDDDAASMDTADWSDEHEQGEDFVESDDQM